MEERELDKLRVGSVIRAITYKKNEQNELFISSEEEMKLETFNSNKYYFRSMQSNTSLALDRDMLLVKKADLQLLTNSNAWPIVIELVEE